MGTVFDLNSELTLISGHPHFFFFFFNLFILIIISSDFHGGNTNLLYTEDHFAFYITF